MDFIQEHQTLHTVFLAVFWLGGLAAVFGKKKSALLGCAVVYILSTYFIIYFYPLVQESKENFFPYAIYILACLFSIIRAGFIIKKKNEVPVSGKKK